MWWWTPREASTWKLTAQTGTGLRTEAEVKQEKQVQGKDEEGLGESSTLRRVLADARVRDEEYGPGALRARGGAHFGGQ